jgi:hypothetical protein
LNPKKRRRESRSGNSKRSIEICGPVASKY